MFQATTFYPHCVTIFHPPEIAVSMDMLFESELLFAWGQLIDPHTIKDQLGRYVPFAPAAIHGYSRRTLNEFNHWRFDLDTDKNRQVQGSLYIGITEEEFAYLDEIEKVPIHMLREKILCTVGNIERMGWVYLRQGALIGK